MFLKHGAKNLNEIELVAPTGFEPVSQASTDRVYRKPSPFGHPSACS